MTFKINPFNPNSTVSTNLFAGRKAQIWKVIGKLEQVRNGMPASFFLSGVRGIGKTALARLIKSVAIANETDLGKLNFLTSYYSIENGQNIQSALQFSLNELTDQLPINAIEVLSKGLGDLFKKGKFSIGVFSTEIELHGKIEIVALKDQMVAVLSKLIDAIKASTEPGETKDGILIIIDELHNVENLDFCAQLFRGIVTTLDVKEKGFVSFLLIGYEETKEVFFKSDASARRLFDIIDLDVMPQVEAKEVLTKGFEKINVSYDEAALDKNIMVTGGYPHSIQMIGHNLIESDVEDHIGEDDWQKAITKTAAELQSKDFADMYDFKGKPTGREMIMDVLAIAPKPLTLKEISVLCKQPKNIYQYIPLLKSSHSIRINPKDETVELHSHLFKTAILLHIVPRLTQDQYLADVVAAFHKSDFSEK